MVEQGAIISLPQTIRKVSVGDNNLVFGLYLLELFFLNKLEWINATLQHMSHSPEEVLRSFLFFSCNNRRRIYQDNSTIETMKTSFCNLDTFQKSRWVKLGIFQGFSFYKN